MTLPDRILAAFRAIVRAEFPRLRFFGCYDYVISDVSGAPPNVTIGCDPADPTIGLPSLGKIDMQPGISGMTSIPTTGLHCVVFFLDGNPTKPRIFGVDSLGVNPVARLGDQVTMFLPPTLPIQGVTAIGPFVGTVLVANPITGIISQGSGAVFSG